MKKLISIIGILLIGLIVNAQEIGLTGSYEAKTGIVSENAYLWVESTRIDYKNSTAIIKYAIYSNASALASGKAPIGDGSISINIEAQEIKDLEGNVLYTIPAFADILGVNVISDPTKNTVALIYALIKSIPQFNSWTNLME